MRRFAALILVFGLALTASADVVHLKDGSRLDGDVKKGAAGYTVKMADGTVKTVSSEQVKSIELGATPGSAEAGKQKLDSLRRSVEYLDDPVKIIQRYQRFIEQSANTPIELEARKDLTIWQDRQTRGLVKFANKWVTPAEREQLQEKAFQQADAARKLIKAGKLAEADSTIQQALAEDPNNAAAIFLRGLLQFRQDQVINARQSFEQVNKLVPNHAPTLNNLAVIAVRQNQIIQAINYYDQAMTAAPGTRDVLNNVAELLYNMPDQQRDTPAAQKVLRKFDEQDIALSKELEKQNLHRWGSTWVTSEQLDQLREAERAAKDKLDQLSSEFDAVKVRITNIDRDIAENERSMRRMEATSYVRDVNGNMWQTELPSSYGAMQNDNRKLAHERDEQFARLNQLREQAKAVNRNLPVPKYTGIQRLMEENFAPIQMPAGATTQPANAAATKPAA
jgi:Flp pilus assembly protein TadD